jgi:hypothetical protein
MDAYRATSKDGFVTPSYCQYALITHIRHIRSMLSSGPPSHLKKQLFSLLFQIQAHALGHEGDCVRACQQGRARLKRPGKL